METETDQKLLYAINSPKDLKHLGIQELQKLAGEIRQTIIEVTSTNGGHLAPNLGVVETGIALHYVFDSPKDKIVWDCSHQAYVHKLLTGRAKKFHTLRQYGGISGFLRRKESEHDVFGAGHASTGLSAAVGIAQARDLKNEDYAVVCVVGDGALTGGMSLEALNNLGYLGLKMIVVLNDNGMSISPNVGAISAYTNRLAVENRIYKTPIYHQVRSDIHYLLDKTPADDAETITIIRRLREAALHVLSPGIFFEEMGYSYIGPIDGHDLPVLIDVFRKAREMPGPVLVHVLTKKGLGYAPAETDSEKFHRFPEKLIKNGVNGFVPYKITIGEKKGITYTEAFTQALIELAKQDKRIVAVTAAMPSGTGLAKFGAEFPEQFFDVGICEEHAVTFCAGMAANGLLPVCAIYSTFLQRGFDQMLHDVCLQELPVTFVLDRAGLIGGEPDGGDGETAQGAFDIVYTRMMPNMVVMAPKDENEVGHMLKTALYSGRPCAIRWPRGSGPGAALEEPRTIPIGKGELMKDGKDLAIVSYGHVYSDCAKAAENLEASGINALLVNARFAKPLDEELLLKAAETGKVLTVEEGCLAGGFGSAVMEFLEEKKFKDVAVKRIGLPDEFIEHGPARIFKQRFGLDAEGIELAAKELVGK